jgi:hypothetical protein
MSTCSPRSACVRPAPRRRESVHFKPAQSNGVTRRVVLVCGAARHCCYRCAAPSLCGVPSCKILQRMRAQARLTGRARAGLWGNVVITTTITGGSQYGAWTYVGQGYRPIGARQPAALSAKRSLATRKASPPLSAALHTCTVAARLRVGHHACGRCRRDARGAAADGQSDWEGGAISGYPASVPVDNLSPGYIYYVGVQGIGPSESYSISAS